MSVHWGQPNYSLPYRQEQTWLFRNPFTLSQSYRQTDWPLPAPALKLSDYGFTFSNIRLLIHTAVPFVQSDWPLPTPVPGPIIQNTIRLMSSTPGNPAVQYDWPNPAPISGYGTWIQNLLQSTLAPVSNKPAVQYDWPLPNTFVPLLQTHVQVLNLNLVPTFNPPFAFDYGDPLRIVWYRDWTQNLSQSTLQPIVQSPFNKYDYPNPLPVIWYRSWEQNLVTYTPQPLPFNKSDYPNPRTYSPIDQTWFNDTVSLLSLVNILPFSQSDWPLPKVPAPIDQSWWQDKVLYYPLPPPPVPILSTGRQIKAWEVRAAEGFIEAVREYASKGGHHRAKLLTSDQRSAIASKAASARWQK